ncbi:MAG: methylated-DNA--[protein]-cysteine S-methyltransferase [Candidatus Cloacimonetes bacterium]|nr:methylated-DNA--[protein]-cysteine S-methyltransferase [Candidatus Cloacimonadota bacterium]
MKYVLELEQQRIMIRTKDLGIREVYFTEEHAPAEGYKFFSRGEEELYKRASEQFSEYFQGKRTSFELFYHFQGSELEMRVWTELRNINYGKTISYGDLACRCGKPRAVRAIASAVGRNKLMILIPCHRVILKSGEPGNYAGGEDKKRMLLDLERKVKDNQ